MINTHTYNRAQNNQSLGLLVPCSLFVFPVLSQSGSASFSPYVRCTRRLVPRPFAIPIRLRAPPSPPSSSPRWSTWPCGLRLLGLLPQSRPSLGYSLSSCISSFSTAATHPCAPMSEKKTSRKLSVKKRKRKCQWPSRATEYDTRRKKVAKWLLRHGFFVPFVAWYIPPLLRYFCPRKVYAGPPRCHELLRRPTPPPRRRRRR